MDLQEPSNELARLRAEVEKLRLDLNRIDTLTRQLEGARDQLRRSSEGIERRDVIIREARKQIATLSRKLDEARHDVYETKKALHRARGTRWYALRDAVHAARGRPWRWLLVPFKMLRPRAGALPAEPEAPSPAWEPAAPHAARPPAARSPHSLRVAAIVGSALRAQLDPECSLFTFGPDDWQSVLEDSKPHLLLVEADVFANDGSWQEQLEKDSSGHELRSLISWCRERQVPTALWNTADPLEFDRWLAVATMFDNIFTVDADAVRRYAARGALGVANITALSPSVQPRTFGSESAGRVSRACFVLTETHTADARAWSDTRAVLTMVKDTTDVYSAPGVTIPNGTALEIRELAEPLQALYRRYAVAVSTPARGDAAGKIPQRVLEMLASGVAVAAFASPDVSLHLASVVETFAEAGAAAGVVHRLLDDERLRASLAAQGELFVLRSHTAMDRLATIGGAAGLRVDADAERRVAALVLADDPEEVGVALRALASQSRPADEIIVGTKARPSDVEAVVSPGVRTRIVKQNGDARPQRLRELARMASTPWLYVVASGAAADSLEQLVLRAPFADADVVVHARDDVAPAVVRRDLVAERGWPDDADTLRRWSIEGVRVYAARR